MSPIDKKKTSSFPSHFIINTSTVTEKPIIADKFNEYFCEIGPKLAKSIPSPRNPHVNFQSILGTPCLDDFIFIIKHIQNLKPKSSSGNDQISSKLKKLAQLFPSTFVLSSTSHYAQEYFLIDSN